MKMDRNALIESIADSFTTMARARAAGGPEPWLGLDLTLPQMKVLMLLDAAGTARPSQIADATGATATGVTGILDRLVERSLVSREPDPEDRRALMVRLEPAGHAILDALHSAGRSSVTQLLEDLSDDDLQALRQGMAALVQRALEVRVQPRVPTGA